MLHLIELFESFRTIRSLVSKDRVNYIECEKNKMKPTINTEYNVHSIKNIGWAVEINLNGDGKDNNPKKMNLQIPIEDFMISANHDSIRWSDDKKYYEISLK